MKQEYIIGIVTLVLLLALWIGLSVNSMELKIEPKIEPAANQKIKLPAHEEMIEIERKHGRPPFRILRKVPEKEIEIQNNPK